MKNSNFLPKWYIYKRYAKISKFINIGNIILFVLSIYISSSIYRNYHYYKELLDREIEVNKSLMDLKDNTQEKEVIAKTEINIGTIYNEIKSELGNRCFENLEISKNDTKIKILHSSLEDYLVFIKSIERGEHFEIVDLQPPVKHDDFVDNLITLRYIK